VVKSMSHFKRHSKDKSRNYTIVDAKEVEKTLRELASIENSPV